MATSEVITIDDEEFYQWKAVLRIPKNWSPESGVFIAVAPPGGVGVLPAIAQGDPGFSPTIRNVTLTELDYDDTTDASGEWTLITAATSTAGPVYDLELTLHAGAPGTSGTFAMLDATDLDDGSSGPTAEYIFAINSTADGVELVAVKVGDMYWPTSFTSVSNVTGNSPMAQVTIPGQPWDWRPRVHGQALVSYDGTDCQVDVVARLNNASTGDVVGRGFGTAGSTALACVPVLSSAPPAASLSTYGLVSAGASATIYFRTEQQGSGSSTYDVSNTKMLFSVEVAPAV